MAQMRDDIKPPDFMEVLAELKKVELVRAGRLLNTNINENVLKGCSRYIDKVTRTKREFLGRAFVAMRNLFRAVMNEAGIAIESDGHLYNLIVKFCRMMRTIQTVQRKSALQRLKRFVAALAPRAHQLPA